MEALALRPPRALGAPLGTASLRTSPEDFVVEEELGFAPSGTGPHWLLQVRKRQANTQWVARELANAGGVRAQDVGYAGLKDRRAIATQWFSVPTGRLQQQDWLQVRGEGFEVLQAHPHQRKLPRGALRGNRFRIRVRGLCVERGIVEARLEAIARHGVPNYFGPQRFGNDLRNLRVALRGAGGSRRPDAYALSAARSLVFNAVLARRVVDGSWNMLLPGDLANLDGRNSVFAVEAVDSELQARCARLDLHPSGPLPGQGEPQPRGAVLGLEADCIAAFPALAAYVHDARAEAARRPLRLKVEAIELHWPGPVGDLEVQFALRSGSFATTVLRELIDVADQETGDD